MIKVYYMSVWKDDNEIPYFVQLIFANENNLKKKQKES
jgi:hypothetical protein